MRVRGEQGKREGSPRAEAFSGQVSDSSRRCTRMKRKGRSARTLSPALRRVKEVEMEWARSKVEKVAAVCSRHSRNIVPLCTTGWRLLFCRGVRTEITPGSFAVPVGLSMHYLVRVETGVEE